MTADIRFPSLAALKAAHGDLLQRRRADGERPDLLDEITAFVARGQATGALLDDGDAREAAQSLLTYWANLLYRAGREPPDSTLADFDPLLAPELPDALCPYLGLDAFREDDHDRFFGRRELIAKLVEQLVHHRLLAVVGPSGSGKSSLVRAGLIPALKAGALPGSQDWRYLPPIVPGSDPLASLARLSANHRPPTAAAGAQPDADQETTDNGQSTTDNQIIVVDQFEELFTLSEDAGAREAFIGALLELAAAPSVQHRVILTMRSDFETFVARVPVLQPLFEQGRIQVTPLSAGELRDAIEQPAAVVGLKFEAGVVDALLQDILGEPAALPLLQFTLLKLWENRQRNRVTWEAYRKIGGGRLALARSADAFYAALIPEEQTTARRILLRMVRPGEGLEITSSRIRRDDLYRGGEDPGRIERVLGKLVAARLVRLTSGETPGDDQVEVAHEALVRNWPTLVDWLEEEKVAIATRRRLEGRAAEWVRLGKGSSGLLDEVELREAEHWLAGAEAADLGYDATLLELVEASRAAIEKAQQEQEAARQRELQLAQKLAATQARIAQRLRLAATALLVLLALALAATAVAIFQQNEARSQGNLARTAEAAARADADTRAIAQATAQQDAMIARTAEAKAQTAQADAQRETMKAQQAQQQETAARAAAELQARAGDSLFVLNRGDVDNALLLVRAAISSNTQAELPLIAYARRRVFEATVRSLPLTGHTNWVLAAAWSPDGRQVVTTGDDATARIWDVETGHPVRTLTNTNQMQIRAVAWSPDGRFILTGSADKTARVWDAATGQPVRTLAGHLDEVRAVAWSPDGRFILTGSADKTARVWDAATGQPVRTLTGHSGGILAVAWSHDGRQVVTGSADQTAHLWDISNPGTTAAARILRGHTTWVFSVAWSLDGRYVLTGSGDQTARVWDAATGQPVRILTGHTGEVRAVAWSPDGEQVLTGSADQTAHVWDVVTGKLVQSLEGHTGAIWSVAWSPDGEQVLTGSADQTARVWDVATGVATRMLIGNGGDIWAVTWNPDGRQVLIGSQDGVVSLWDALTGQFIRSLPKTGAVWAAAWSPDGRQILTGSADKTARIWDAATGQSVRTLAGHLDEVRAVAWSPDGRFILTGSADKTARIWDAATGHPLRTLTDTNQMQIRAVAWSPDGRFILTGSADQTARVWDAATGNPPEKLPASAGDVWAVAWSPDGRQVLTGNGNGTANVWDVVTGRQVRTFIGHTGGIRSVAWSPDGRQVLTGSADRTVRLWDSATGDPIQTLEGHAGEIWTAAWSPDARQVLTGSQDGTARLWIVDKQLITAELTRRICTLFRGREEMIGKTVPGWRDCRTELASVDTYLKIYDTLRGGR